MKHAPPSVAKVDGGAAQLRLLSDEVAKIARTLEGLAFNPKQPAASQMLVDPPRPTDPTVLRDQVRSIIRARRLRERFFREDLFADPAWDILLELFQAESTQIRVTVSSLCHSAAVPATTALRWIKTLTEGGLLMRRMDPHDGRRVFIELTAVTSQTMHAYFNTLNETPQRNGRQALPV